MYCLSVWQSREASQNDTLKAFKVKFPLLLEGIWYYKARPGAQTASIHISRRSRGGMHAYRIPVTHPALVCQIIICIINLRCEPINLQWTGSIWVTDIYSASAKPLPSLCGMWQLLCWETNVRVHYPRANAHTSSAGGILCQDKGEENPFMHHCIKFDKYFS